MTPSCCRLSHLSQLTAILLVWHARFYDQISPISGSNLHEFGERTGPKVLGALAAPDNHRGQGYNPLPTGTTRTSHRLGVIWALEGKV